MKEVDEETDKKPDEETDEETDENTDTRSANAHTAKWTFIPPTNVESESLLQTIQTPP
jgi:hypothetical protein